MRFCSRCGFQLDIVSALVTGGGAGNAVLAAPVHGSKGSPGKRGIRTGAQIMIAGAVMLPIALAFSIVIDTLIPMFLPATVLILGLLLLFYHWLFGENVERSVQSPARLGNASTKYLPSHQSIPASSFTKPAARTAEIAQPPSITENTTRLLDKES
jgi:hypothetical protein